MRIGHLLSRTGFIRSAGIAPSGSHHASPAWKVCSGPSPTFETIVPETTNAMTPLACTYGSEPVPGGYISSTRLISRSGSPGSLCLITSRRVEVLRSGAGCAAAALGNVATTVKINEWREKELKRRLVTAGSILMSAFITVSLSIALLKGRQRRADTWGPYGLVDSAKMH